MAHLITTRPVCDPCPRCGRLQLTGNAEGLAYRADPAPLTPHAELAARIAGRRTYALIAGQLAYRTAERISGDHRGRPPVFPQHRCEQPPQPADIDTTHLVATTRLIQNATPKDNRPAPLSNAEFNAVFLLSRELGAVVIAEEPAEPAPF